MLEREGFKVSFQEQKLHSLNQSLNGVHKGVSETRVSLIVEVLGRHKTRMIVHTKTMPRGMFSLTKESKGFASVPHKVWHYEHGRCARIAWLPLLPFVSLKLQGSDVAWNTKCKSKRCLVLQSWHSPLTCWRGLSERHVSVECMQWEMTFDLTRNFWLLRARSLLHYIGQVQVLALTYFAACGPRQVHRDRPHN